MPRPVRRAPSSPIVVLSICVWYAALAAVLGKDVNWDLLNYHYYNGYAFVTGRGSFDLAPAQLQTFLNPLLDVPLYFAITHLPPLAVGVLYGFVQGLNGVAVWAMARRLLPIEADKIRDWAAFALALVSGLGAANLCDHGGSMGDTLAGIPVLFSLAFLVRSSERLRDTSNRVALRLAVTAGAIAGIGPGLKLTAFPYAVGIAVGCLFLTQPLSRRVVLCLACGVGVVAGWLLVSGFWLWDLYDRFQSPLFPFFNNLFRSEWAPTDVVRDDRFLPRSVASLVFYPFVWLVDPSVVSEHPFRDLRVPLLYVLSVFLGVRACARRFRAGGGMPSGTVWFLAVAGWAAYVLWLLIFGIYRYLGPLDWLTSLGLTLALHEILPTVRRGAIIVATLALMTLTTKPLFYGRAGWATSYFDVTIPPLSKERPRLVIIAGLEPVGFLVPHFPPDVRFVRIEGMTLGGARADRFEGLVARAVASHSGAMYLLGPGPETEPTLEKALARLGLRRTEPCRSVGVPNPLPPPPYALVRPGYVTRPLIAPLLICRVGRG
jgi:hypothetical protein